MNMMSWLRSALFLGLLATIAPTTQAVAAVRRLVTQDIDEHQTLILFGNTRPEASAARDMGPAPDTLALDHIQILLQRPAETEAALDAYIAQLSAPASPNYHHWLTAAQLGESYGPSISDVREVTAWLGRHGFIVNGVHANHMVIDISGNAGQVRETFGTVIHRLDVNGVSHIANMSDPRIPQALAGIVRGIVSLHDFRPHRNFMPRPSYSFNSQGQTIQVVVPADMATIYNLAPLFQQGYAGQGQTIVVIEDSDVYNVADWSNFRASLGLAGYSLGSFTQIHPASPTQDCADPGIVAGDEVEATLDSEWSSAAAPNAAIELASCADTATNFGGLIALQNLVDGTDPPAIVSISYGECEAENGAAANAAYASVYQQAAAMGISVFVAAGDEGAASCDAGASRATHGIGVSGFASTPYNVAVGGTDFGDTITGTNSVYWAATNSATYGSALSYIPEIPWNDSCAGALVTAAAGYSVPYGAGGFCNSALARRYYLTTTSGSGGGSGCATGAPSVGGVVSGTCQGYAKPSWQSLVGNPADSVRDIPDLSLFAADGLWLHYFVLCDSDIADGGASCNGAPSGWAGGGGTSFAAPIMAAIQALINQSEATRVGNPDPVYYAIAASNYGPTGSAYCLSGNGNVTPYACAFHDVTLGDIDVNCSGGYNCYLPSGRNGILSANSLIDQPAYAAGVGWDFATGIGSVNAYNLLYSWAAGETLVGGNAAKP